MDRHAFLTYWTRRNAVPVLEHVLLMSQVLLLLPSCRGTCPPAPFPWEEDIPLHLPPSTVPTHVVEVASKHPCHGFVPPP